MFKKIKKMVKKNKKNNVSINLWNNDDRSGGYMYIGRYSIDNGLNMMLWLKERGYKFKVMNTKLNEFNIEFY